MTADLAASPQPSEGDTPEPVFADVLDWVECHFLPVYRRPLGGEYRWCSQWWQHPEAITRLTALWQSWEAMRVQPGTGTASWLRDHLDHQLPLLMGRAGPFAQCSPGEHIQMRAAPADSPPPDWWDPGDDPGGSAGPGAPLGPGPGDPAPSDPADPQP
jgi:hypothetical protein